MSYPEEMDYEPVIGLEVHAQLRTRSKLFCGCATDFGAPPNTHTCPVCLGLPGALPVLNREAVTMAAKAALALNCRINSRSIFARKNYFYPDLPKGYQISQYELPLAEEGFLEMSDGAASNRFRIERIHLEDDAGKSTHESGRDSLINLNRTGVPLIEIVTRPDFKTSDQAHDFLAQLRLLLLYLEICDGNMEEGSLRCDANVSVRPAGTQTLGTKAEIKNLNSFRFLKKALEYEVKRQIGVLSKGGRIVQETRLWDESSHQTLAMRSKEYAHDYRYFPDPDLLPVFISDRLQKDLEASLPELPLAKKDRFQKEYQLSGEDAELLIQAREFADYFEETVRLGAEAKSVFNWMAGDLTRHLKRDSRTLSECPVSPQKLSRLIELVASGQISGSMAKQVFEKMYQSGEEPDRIVASEGLRQIDDVDALTPIIEDIMATQESKVAAYRAGKTGLLGFFVGQVMRKTRGQANPQLVNQMLKSKLEAGGKE